MNPAKMNTVVACDLGTTGAKVSLVRRNGEIIASVYQRYKTYYPQAGWAEQCPTDWIAAFVDGTRAVLESSCTGPSEVDAVVLSGHMQGCVPVDGTGRPLTDRAMLWADRRSVSEAAYAMDVICWDSFYSRTGAGLEVVLYPLAKLNWMKKHTPESYKAAAAFLGTKDTVNAWLTGRLATDPSDAADTAMFDLVKAHWAVDMITEVGIDVSKLPEILPSATIVGDVTEAAASATGLLKGTPVVLGAGDVACAATGAGMISDGQAYGCLGSAAWVSLVSTVPLVDPRTRPFVLSHAIPGMYLSQLATYSAGVVIEWLLDEIIAPVSKQNGCVKAVGFDHLMDLANASPVGSSGLRCLPYLRPGGAPSYDPDERGVFYGLELSHKRSDIIRSAVEGISWSICRLVNTFEKHRVAELPALRMIGGGANSSFWMKVIAGMLDKPVPVLRVKQEANTLGAAIIAMVAVGFYHSFAEAIEACVHIDTTYMPNAHEVAQYHDLIQSYERLDLKARELHRRIG